MSEKSIDISVVVVDFNVKEYVSNLFASLYRSAEGLNMEIFLVDNSSIEGSIPYLKARYPHVQYIRNTQNVGFGKANNLAIQQAKGRFTLIINPDTLVSEDCLKNCMQKMLANPEIGALGCKILNADGSFAPESKRSFPGIWSAFCKASGLTNFFPKSELFGGYYVNSLDSDNEGPIPVLSGAFMFFETALLQKLGGFDERFFMYGEDIDLCKRVHEQGRCIWYYPKTNIIHYKGESAKQNDLTYIRSFNEALYLYFAKHYSNSYLKLFKSAVFIAVWLKTILGFISLIGRKLRPLIFDLALINLTLIVAYLERYEITPFRFLEPNYGKLLISNLLVSVFYSIYGMRLGIISSLRYSVIARVKTLFFAFLSFAVIAFFIKEIAFSRLTIGLSVLIDILLFILIYTYRKSSQSSAIQQPGKLNTTRVILVGISAKDQSSNLIKNIRNQAAWNYELIGVLAQDELEEVPEHIEEVPVIGKASQLAELIRAYRVHQVHFIMSALSYKDMLAMMTTIGSSQPVVLKIVPDSMDYILGKSNVEYLEETPVIDVELRFFRSLNIFLKRLNDITLGFTFRLYVFFLADEGKGKQSEWRRIRIDSEKELYIELKWPYQAHRKTNYNILAKAVLSGTLSMVGAPLSKSEPNTTFVYPKGLTGLVQINPNRGIGRSDLHHFDLYYLQNYSIWLDYDILVKSIIRKPDIFRFLEEVEKTNV